MFCFVTIIPTVVLTLIANTNVLSAHSWRFCLCFSIHLFIQLVFLAFSSGWLTFYSFETICMFYIWTTICVDIQFLDQVFFLCGHHGVTWGTRLLPCLLALDVAVLTSAASLIFFFFNEWFELSVESPEESLSLKCGSISRICWCKLVYSFSN